MENKKKIIIGVLCAIVAAMAVGYAALATQLNITGTASIDSTWKVEITNIIEKDKVGDAVSKVDSSYTATTANFSIGLTQPGDSITYDIEVSNLGTLKAKVDSINITTDDNDAIIYKTDGIVKGDTLGVNEKDTLSVTVSYNPEVTSQPAKISSDITLTINYVQDLGQSASVTYDTYSIGDVVTFAGSNWYVIKNSTREEDYVTLLKEKVLTSSELGQYAANQTITCKSWMVESGDYGCTIEGEDVIEVRDTMIYYWSDICHYSGYYGYTESDTSGCSGHSDYEGSKVKEYLEGTYLNTLGVTNLKEIDGYKVRLITTEELNLNLGWVNLDNSVKTDNENSNVPLWIYQNFGELSDYSNRLYGYWTMSPHPLYSPGVWYVDNAGFMMYPYAYTDHGVRPVINLLKSSI